MSLNFSNFQRELRNSGRTLKERADRLKFTERQIFNWQKKGPPKQLQKMPATLLRAMADDIEFAQIPLTEDAEGFQSPQSGHDGFPTTEHSRGEDGWRADSPPEVCP